MADSYNPSATLTNDAKLSKVKTNLMLSELSDLKAAADCRTEGANLATLHICTGEDCAR
jgi:hypothetical protein